PDKLCTRPIDVDVEGRIARRLLDARIRDPGNPANPGHQFIGVGEIRAEIQDLVDDIGWQKSKRHSRKGTWKLFSQRLDVNFRRRMILLQLDLDIAILRADDAG